MAPVAHLILDRHRGAQPPIRLKRAPRRRRPSLSRYGAGARQDLPDPAQLVADMKAAGAEFYIKADVERRQFNYAFRLKSEADQKRIASLVAPIKADRELLGHFRVHVFVAIARAAWDLPPVAK